ncbi:MAG: hypothetical protein E6H44_12845 [Betaproteobacteria bacterium]|nr:MAG: hypothetical protein E6H44_12845 [Betaproteobacteria bacterium]
MMRRLFVTAAVLPLLAFPGVAPADTSLGLRGGTLGGGVELSHAFGPRIGVRLNADAYNYKQTSTYDDIDYDMKMKLQTASLMGDWFPFANNFRISAGAMFNGNKLALKGLPTGGFYTINGVPYNTAQIESLDATVDFNKAAPYIGIGYGRAITRGLSLIFDAGVMFQGSPKSKINLTCGPLATPPECAQAQSDAQAEQSRLDESLHSFKYYPVISLGLAYTF